MEKDQLPASIVLNDMHLQVKTEGEGKQRKKSRKRDEASLPVGGGGERRLKQISANLIASSVL